MVLAVEECRDKNNKEMARILAIDYGKKRTGMAVSDELQLIAGGLTTVATATLIDYILDYVKREPVERIVVGLPKQMNNLQYLFPEVRLPRLPQGISPKKQKTKPQKSKEKQKSSSFYHPEGERKKAFCHR